MNTDQASQSAGCFESSVSIIMHVVAELMAQRAIYHLANDISSLLYRRMALSDNLNVVYAVWQIDKFTVAGLCFNAGSLHRYLEKAKG